MIKWKLRWLHFKENGLLPWLGLLFNLKAIHACAINELLYGTSFQLTVSRRWYNPMRWLLGRKCIKCLDPRSIQIKKLESREGHWGKSAVDNFKIRLTPIKK